MTLTFLSRFESYRKDLSGMAAPQIPNLNTLRGQPGRNRAREKGLGVGFNQEAPDLVKDRIVQQTDQDASVSRLSAVQAGYLHDPFAKLFVKGDIQSRLPIINRGRALGTRADERS